jgi:hypothetical protein
LPSKIDFALSDSGGGFSADAKLMDKQSSVAVRRRRNVFIGERYKGSETNSGGMGYLK